VDLPGLLAPAAAKTLTLLHLLVFALALVLVSLVRRPALRKALLLSASVLAVYWLQPLLPIRHLDFWLATAALTLAVVVWAAARPADTSLRPDLPAAALVAALVLGVALTRYLGPVCCLTPSRPPEIGQVLLALAAAAGLVFVARRRLGQPFFVGAAGFLLIALLVVLKTPSLALAAATALRALSGQSTATAAALDLRWLGFSYLAFRLLHILRDHAAGRLPAVPLQDFMIYAFFFPAYTAGPIDRLPRFVGDLNRDFTLNQSSLLSGGSRLALGLFKKFVLADSLALIALSAANAGQIDRPLWGWVLLYAFSWRIYFDFSGYTDLAIGLGLLAGIRLPENFDRPYLKPNLTAFWNSWHITLAQWFRAYYFNPLTRALRSRPRPISADLILFFVQVTTMLLIGLWHGVTWNFAIWGAWHGLGLFVHNRWINWMRPRSAGLASRPRLKQALEWGSVLLTFQFVSLGWVWFALPDPALALRTFAALFGWIR